MSHEPRPDERRRSLSKKPPTPRRRRSLRRAGAALASIAIHAGVLALFAGPMSRPRTTAATPAAARPAISVSLAPRRAERAASYAPQIRAAPPERPAAARPSPEPIRPETAPEQPEAPPRAADEAVEPAPAGAPSDTAPDAASLPIPGADSEGGARGETGSESVAAAREAAVMARIQAAKTYPDAARRRGIEGEVAVVFAIAADGSLMGVEAERAGAHPLLVRAAAGAVAAAAPYPPGDGDATTYRVTIVYRLER